MTRQPARQWVSVEEAARMLEIGYRTALALVQDGKITSRLKNPAARRPTYLVSVESIEKWERNTTRFARK